MVLAAVSEWKAALAVLQQYTQNVRNFLSYKQVGHFADAK